MLGMPLSCKWSWSWLGEVVHPARAMRASRAGKKQTCVWPARTSCCTGRGPHSFLLELFAPEQLKAHETRKHAMCTLGCTACAQAACKLEAACGAQILCMHGGLSPELKALEQIKRIPRPTDVPDTGLLCDLLWADPDKEARTLRESQTVALRDSQ